MITKQTSYSILVPASHPRRSHKLHGENKHVLFTETTDDIFEPVFVVSDTQGVHWTYAFCAVIKGPLFRKVIQCCVVDTRAVEVTNVESQLSRI